MKGKKIKEKYYKREINIPTNKSFFLFGPRGTGKTTWLKHNFPDAVYINLLKSEVYNELLTHPENIEDFIPPKFKDWVIIDEVQKVPAILNEVHRLIEDKKYKFILTGSSARKLKKDGVNLLAGRALTYHIYPLTISELGDDFDLKFSLKFGFLPSIFFEEDPKKYLESYISTYLYQEILHEGLTRDLPAFGRFLETASFSQGSILNVSAVAEDANIHRKVAENYFSILEDLLIAYFLPSFTKRAKRKNVKKNKFYFFDAGIYRILRPKGPLDIIEEIDGAGLETLVLQELIAKNEYANLEYKIFFWRTVNGVEVDFVLYGHRGIIGIEVKRKFNISVSDLKGLNLFKKDYPEAQLILLYGGKEIKYKGEITFLPFDKFFNDMEKYI